ncbi:zeta toxin family protein [Microbacterium sp. ZW T5_45]|uniref:zeta toxin family protein n=1 Tax=Microbacterium sp. ZW T5_45 TaxID=3378080 RepID=UPI0038554052
MTDRLSQEQLQQIFQVDVREYLDHLRNRTPRDPAQPPRFVSVGGQPGAGKGRVLEDIHNALPGSGIVNGDELRRFHPEYLRLMREEPLRMPEVTGPASGPWVGMANEHLRRQQASAVVETTLRDAPMLQAEFAAFKGAGYVTELRVVAVPLEVSRAATVSRYLEQVTNYGAGRWTPGAAHDLAAANVTDTVRTLVSSGLVDRVVVQDRDDHVFHDAIVSSGGITQGDAAAAAVENARNVAAMTPEQARAWVANTSAVLSERVRLGQNDPDLAQVAKRLATTDGAAVVGQAYPRDPVAQREALSSLQRAARLSLSDRIESRTTALRDARAPKPGDVLGRGDHGRGSSR